MAESGVQCGSDIGSENDGCGSDRYLELSLSGRWIKLASKWLRDNCPCSVSDYYAYCAPLMPTHIGRFRRHQNPKIATARDALGRLTKGVSKNKPLVKVSGDTIDLLPGNRSSFYDYSWIPEESEIGATINLKELGFDIKRAQATGMVLRRRGYVSIGNRTFEYHGE